MHDSHGTSQGGVPGSTPVYLSSNGGVFQLITVNVPRVGRFLVQLKRGPPLICAMRQVQPWSSALGVPSSYVVIVLGVVATCGTAVIGAV